MLAASLEPVPSSSSSSSSSPSPALTPAQTQLASFIERAARCFSESQVRQLRVPFEPDSSQCGVCGVAFWGASVGMTLPKQRHHCYCCGKSLCNRCTVTVSMENGHSVDGVYRKDFCWTARFCINHELITGETKELAAATESDWKILPSGPLEWLGFLVRVGSTLVSVFPVVSTLSTVYSMGRPLLWTYRVVRLFV